MRITFTIIACINILYSCGDADTSQTEKGRKDVETVNMKEKGIAEDSRQLNINILWDLSDRIDSSKNPSSPQHYKRDFEIIKFIVGIFKNDMKKKGAYKAKSKIRVFFTPAPQNEAINNMAKALTYDLSLYSGDGATQMKREAYDSMEIRFSRNEEMIYKLAIADNKSHKQWDGSDIWRFFKNDVVEYCVDRDTAYRNILVVLTDGYIYHKDSKIKKGNRTSYILPEQVKIFRRNEKWREVFNNGNYGLITSRDDLAKLEILVLEINPSPENKNDEDFIKYYLEKWFLEMGVESEDFKCYNSDLPEYTKSKIQRFFDRK